MAWSAFFGLVMGAYAVYYVLNFLYDLFFLGRGKAPADAGVHYEMDALAEEEQAHDLSQEEAEDNYPYADDYDEDEDEDEEEGQPYAQQELCRTPAPALRVEGQGIPLDEFLQEAKSYSSSIF